MSRLADIMRERSIDVKDIADNQNLSYDAANALVLNMCLPTVRKMDDLTALLGCDVLDIYDRKELTFRTGTHFPENNYKITVRMPKEAKERLSEMLPALNFKSVTDWVMDCYRKLIDEYERKH